MHDPVDTYMNTLVPMVVEQSSRGERAFDIYSRLLRRAGDFRHRRCRRLYGQPDYGAAFVPRSGESEKGNLHVY